jgi:hypothetical protein
MKRRTIHLILLQLTTAAMFVSVAMALIYDKGFGFAATVLAAWLLVLGILTTLCLWSVPDLLKKWPEMPPEFLEILPGSVTPAARAMLAKSVIVKDRSFRNRRHILYRLEQPCQEGLWRCFAEETAGKIVAWEVEFESADSPLLDRVRAAGEGRFILVPSNLSH